jgi:GNAT superfamily N-acetyltransferase
MAKTTAEYALRSALPADAALIARQRAAMFQDMGAVTRVEAEALREASEPWIAGLMANAEYVGWIVQRCGSDVAGGGIILLERGPAPGCNRIGRWAHIVNIYTAPEHRRRGRARRLMHTILEWCEAHGIDHVTLGASDQGRPLYESLGFQPTSRHMELRSPKLSGSLTE